MQPVDFLIGSNFENAFNLLNSNLVDLNTNLVIFNDYMQGVFFKYFFAYMFIAVLFGVFLGFFMWSMFKILTRSK